MMMFLARVRPAFLRDERAASSAEFALVLPLMLLFLLGILDVGRYSWQLNKIEKGAQMGVRYAVVTNPVDTSIQTETYLNNTACGTALTAGDIICRGALGEITCTSTACSCTQTPCSGTRTFSSAAFQNILARVQAFSPEVKAANLSVSYSGSGLGYVTSDASAVSIAPLVTIKISGINFSYASMLGKMLPFPAIARSQTLEDGMGSYGN